MSTTHTIRTEAEAVRRLPLRYRRNLAVVGFWSIVLLLVFVVR